VGGTYPSLIGPDEGEERLVACYGGDDYARLRRLKARYDPENVFSLNPNIEP
jgi:FAD/FMN-containing dehydrogenase